MTAEARTKIARFERSLWVGRVTPPCAPFWSSNFIRGAHAVGQLKNGAHGVTRPTRIGRDIDLDLIGLRANRELNE